MDRLVHALADLGLEFLGLLCGEELLDVEDELGLDVVGEFLVAGEDLDVTVVDEAGVGLDHVLLDDGRTGHGVVQDMEVLVDRLGGDFLTETLLQGLVGKVHPDDDGSPDIVPHLLHSRVVDEVQVVALDEDAGAADLVGHQLALAHRYTAQVAALGVVHGYAAVHLGGKARLHELHLARRLANTVELVELGGLGLDVLSLELLLEGFQEQLLGSLNLCHCDHSSLGMKPYFVRSEWMRWTYSMYSVSSR
ncbi:MAG: hypothetical protein BWX50_00221 [Euryarchaeota archaeon ADurb.Bin009]|nr:MAG: hypothetical protein BWX50_00221 [Euryarchaeota archaeon ADurb.Bin009]